MKKLALRDLFWLLLVTAIGLAWWRDRGQQAQQVTALAQECQTWKDRADQTAEMLEGYGGPGYRWGDDRKKVYYTWPAQPFKSTRR